MPTLDPNSRTYENGYPIMLRGSFRTNGTGAPTNIRDGHSYMVQSVVRVSPGLYTVTLDAGYPIPELLVTHIVDMDVIGSPVTGAKADYVEGSWSESARTFQVQVYEERQVPALVTGQAVTANVAALTAVGPITGVQATAGTTAGVKTIILSGVPSTGQVLVAYTDGVPTLTFATADAVTATEYVQTTHKPVAVDPDSTCRISYYLSGSISSAGTDLA